MHISKQNNLDISKICSATFECECGKEHIVSTKSIVIGSDITAEFYTELQKIVPIGAKIFVVSDNTVWNMYGSAMLRRLERLGYRTQKAIFEDEFLPSLPFTVKLPEDISLILAIGGGTVVDTAKYIAQPQRIPVYVYSTTMFAKNILAPSAFVNKNGFVELVKVNAPIGLCADIKNLSTYSRLEICYALASYCANCLSVFDWYLLSVVELTEYCKGIANQILDSASQLVKELYSYLAGEIDNSRLQQSIVEKNTRLGVLCQCIGDSRLVCGSPTIAAIAIKMAKIPCAFFVAELNASKRLNDIYAECIIFSTTAQKEFIPPPDNHHRSELIVELLGVNNIYNYSKITPYYNKGHIDNCVRKISSHKNVLLSILKTQKVLFESVIMCIKKVQQDHLSGLAWGINTKQNNQMSYRDIPQAMFDRLIALSPDVHLKPTALSVFKQLSALERYL